MNHDRMLAIVIFGVPCAVWFVWALFSSAVIVVKWGRHRFAPRCRCGGTDGWCNRCRRQMELFWAEWEERDDGIG